MSILRQGRFAIAVLLCGIVATTCGCKGRNAMRRQPRVNALRESAFYPDGLSIHSPPQGTVSFGGQPMGPSARSRPAITAKVLLRGRERYDIFCSMCHGRDGYGRGMVERRNFPPAPSLHIERLRSVSDEHLFDVISNGQNASPPLADVIAPDDRWAIVAYIRALQLNQHASEADLAAVGTAAAEGRGTK